MYNDFHYKFIASVAKTNWSEVSDLVVLGRLRDQSQQSFIHIKVHPTSMKGTFTEGDDFSPYYASVSVEEGWVDPIRSRCIEGFE